MDLPERLEVHPQPRGDRLEPHGPPPGEEELEDRSLLPAQTVFVDPEALCGLDHVGGDRWVVRGRRPEEPAGT